MYTNKRMCPFPDGKKTMWISFCLKNKDGVRRQFFHGDGRPSPLCGHSFPVGKRVYGRPDRVLTGKGYKCRREITNNHAHSWPEVYFPGVGWVPFEPTVGYGGFGSQNGDLPGAAPEVPESPAEQPEMTELDGNEPAEEQEPEDGAPENGQEESADEAVSEHPQGRAKNIHLLLAAASGFAGLLASGFYVTRKKWLPYYYLHRFRGRNENEAFLEAYRVLLKQLERRGIKRRPEQTLGDYAQTVDKKFSTADMSMMTKHYEQYLYKGVLEEDSWRTLKEAWERLMKTLA